MSHQDYLTAVVVAVKKYGRASLVPVNYPKTKEWGFKAPDGTEVLINVRELKEFFGCEGLGLLPHNNVVRTHILMVQDAIVEGERLRQWLS